MLNALPCYYFCSMASALDVILVDDVEHLGRAGELVKAKPGYVRNYLLPKGLATIADRFSLAEYEERKAQLEADAEKRRAEAETLKIKLEEKVITIDTKAGETGKLFGAITKEVIVETIKDQLALTVSKDQIVLKAPIRAVGDHDITLKISAGVSTKIIVQVKAI